MTNIVLVSGDPFLMSGMEVQAKMRGSSFLLLACIRPECATEFIAAAAPAEPIVMLVEASDKVTYDYLRHLRQAAPDNVRIALWAADITNEMAYQALQIGVRGIVRKTLDIAAQFRVIEAIGCGELMFEKSLTDRFLTARRVGLSMREGQLVNLLARGQKNKEIAHELGITEGTVKVYLSRLFAKVGVKDRFELALLGLRNLTSVPGQALPQNGPTPLVGLRSMVAADSELRPNA